MINYYVQTCIQDAIIKASQMIIIIILLFLQFTDKIPIDKDGINYGFSEAEDTKLLFSFSTVYNRLQCDSNGIEYTIEEYDITLRIPKGAVSEDQVIHFEIGISMASHGPFTFPDNTQPISPLCFRRSCSWTTGKTIQTHCSSRSHWISQG